MSFATLGASRDGSTLTLRKGELSLSVPANGTALPDEVVVGIRPEHAHTWADDAGLVGPIDGRATFVEMLGRETLIGVETAGEQLTVLADADSRVVPGDGVRFGVEPGKVFLFDPATTEAIAIV